MSPGEITLSNGAVVPLKLVRSAGRQMKLSILPDTIRVSLPSGTSEQRVQAFLRDNMDWIETNIRTASPALAQGRLVFGDEGPMALRGAQLPLVWHRSGRTHAALLNEEGTGEGDDVLHVWVPEGAPDSHGRKAVREWLAQTLRKDIAALLERWLPSIPQGHVSHLALASTHGQWGSMNSGKRMAIDHALVGARPQALEYVIIHELCHQIHMNHSRAFWNEVRKRCPRYTQEELYLGRVGGQLKAILGRLGD